MRVWVVTEDSGLNGSWVTAVFDHEPTHDEVAPLLEPALIKGTGRGLPTGYGGHEVTEMEVLTT